MTSMNSSATTEYSRTRRECGCSHCVRCCEGISMSISRVDEAAGCGPRYRFGSRCDIELAAGVFDVEIHGALAQAQNRGDLRRGFTPCRPGQAFQFAIVQRYGAGPNLIARPPSQARLDNRCEDLEIDRFGDVVVGARTAPLGFTSGCGAGG